MEELPEARMIACLKKIAVGPTKSHDLTQEEARDGMSLILRRQISDVQAGVFLVALRMKRETDDEHRGILEALREATLSVTAPIPDLIEIADPYDGFKRHPPITPFLLPLLAACGVPAISHGTASVGPKFGVTHQQIFKKAGIPIDLTPIVAARQLANPAVGWAYLDQSIFCPSLHQLTELRRLIVKRPCIATLEKLCGPVRAVKNHLIVGYVHPGYELQIPMSARHAGYDSCLTVRGIEGGVLLPMNKVQSAYLYTDKSAETDTIIFDPREIGITTELRSVSPRTDQLAEESAKLGIAVLNGEPGPVRDGFIFTASAILYALNRFSSLPDAASVVRDAIDSGAAFARFSAGREI